MGSSGRILLHPARARTFPEWSIPLAYSVAAVLLGVSLPRLERLWFPDLVAPISTGVAIAINSSVASGMIALTGIVFALAFVMVQFGSVAYSPRVVPWIARDPLVMHALGAFTATFLYALTALAWVDRPGLGHVPFISTAVLIALLLAAVGVFIALVQRLRQLQVQSILIFIGGRGREVIDILYPPLETPPTKAPPSEFETLPVTQVLVDTGRPRTIQALDISALLRASVHSGGVIEIACAVGDTIGEGMVLLRVYGAQQHIVTGRIISPRCSHAISEPISQAPRHRGRQAGKGGGIGYSPV